MKNKILMPSIIRRLLYCLLMFAAFILQFTIIPKTGISVPVYFLIPLTVCTAMFEKEFSGLLFGLLSGALWDLASPVTDGFLALAFAFFGCLTGLLTHYLLRNTLLSAIILNITAVLLYTVILQVYFIESFSLDLLSETLREHFLLPLLITLILTVPIYFLIRSAAKKFHTENL